MILCKCREPAEVRWSVNGEKERRQVHELCTNCMSRIWSEIQLKYQGSNALEASLFEPINQ